MGLLELLIAILVILLILVAAHYILAAVFPILTEPIRSLVLLLILLLLLVYVYTHQGNLLPLRPASLGLFLAEAAWRS
jgi:hypothetical protein